MAAPGGSVLAFRGVLTACWQYWRSPASEDEVASAFCSQWISVEFINTTIRAALGWKPDGAQRGGSAGEGLFRQLAFASRERVA
jgi:hypothetical protein